MCPVKVNKERLEAASLEAVEDAESVCDWQFQTLILASSPPEAKMFWVE